MIYLKDETEEFYLSIKHIAGIKISNNQEFKQVTFIVNAGNPDFHVVTFYPDEYEELKRIIDKILKWKDRAYFVEKPSFRVGGVYK